MEKSYAWNAIPYIKNFLKMEKGALTARKFMIRRMELTELTQNVTSLLKHFKMDSMLFLS